MKKTETNLLHEENLKKIEAPGEYGGKHSPCGWTYFEYKGKKVFLTSIDYSIIKRSNNFTEAFYTKHEIPKENTVNLLEVEEKTDIELTGETEAVLKEFKEFIAEGTRIKNKNILIHCKHGLNRTPVAAVIYLLGEGDSLGNALNIVNGALEKRKLPNVEATKVNEKEMFSSVLKAAVKNPQPLSVNISSTVPSSSTTQTNQKEWKREWMRIRPSEVKEVVEEGHKFTKGEITTRFRGAMQKIREGENPHIKESNVR